MKKWRLVFVLLCIFAAMIFAPTAALADTGPKASVVITLNGLKEKNCYVTLLSKNYETFGPYWVYDGNPDRARYKEGKAGYDIWQKFVAHQDKVEGFYFLQYFGKVDDKSTFKWGYYPPREFKILIYFPKTDTFYVSDQAYQQYAFDSYFKVDASKIDPKVSGEISAVKDYNSSWEILSLFVRMLITIAIELMIAFMFGYFAKKQILVILITNLFTQTLLNLLMNTINYNKALRQYRSYYIMLELLVVLIEATVYYFALNKYSRKPNSKKWVAVAYAFTANAASFVIGLFIANVIPAVF